MKSGFASRILPLPGIRDGDAARFALRPPRADPSHGWVVQSPCQPTMPAEAPRASPDDTVEASASIADCSSYKPNRGALELHSRWRRARPFRVRCDSTCHSAIESRTRPEELIGSQHHASTRSIGIPHLSRPSHNDSAYRAARKVVIALIGTTLVLIGVILVFTPGPAFLVLTLALAVLASEFVWARRWLLRLREGSTGVARRLGVRFGHPDGGDQDGDDSDDGQRGTRESKREQREARMSAQPGEKQIATRTGEPS